MAFANQGSNTKLEVVRGIANTLTYWPNVDGALTNSSAQSVTIYDPAGVSITTPVVTDNGNNSLTFPWTPASSLALVEDYYYDVTFTDAGSVVRTDRVYFDLVRVAFLCPVAQDNIEALYPQDLGKWLTSKGLSTTNGAQQFIQQAWQEIVQRIRAQGSRPALLTDRFAFVAPCEHLALANLFTALVKEPGDNYDHKRLIHLDRFDRAWAALGPLKFEDTEQTGGPVVSKTVAQRGFRI